MLCITLAIILSTSSQVFSFPNNEYSLNNYYNEDSEEYSQVEEESDNYESEDDDVWLQNELKAIFLPETPLFEDYASSEDESLLARSLMYKNTVKCHETKQRILLNTENHYPGHYYNILCVPVPDQDKSSYNPSLHNVYHMDSCITAHNEIPVFIKFDNNSECWRYSKHIKIQTGCKHRK